ncbi:MAG: response regulator, partial [Planctomycetes bacterium]|nr:response regulator [Planctomycetota bacterium]
ERRLLSERTSGSEHSRAIALATTLVSAVVGLVLVGAFVRLFRRDIGIRAQSARILHEQKEIFRTTLASIGDGVITTDPDGRVWFLNGVAESLTGWTSKEAEGIPLENVFHIVNEQTRRPVDNPALRALREGVVVGLANHTVLVAKDGKERPIDDSAAPIRDAQGNLTGVVLVFRDVTQRRETERALHDADRRKDEFLAVLSHELRNPLAPLRNALEILHRADDDQRAVTKVRGIMERQVQQMVRLIDDLLDISRITHNVLELRRDAIEVASIVTGAMESSGPLLAERGQQVTLNLPSTPIYVDGDKSRLTQALCNLLGNSAKYSEPGGHVTVTVLQCDRTVELRVTDTGIGIPAEMLDRVFEMFERGERSPKQRVDGLGIGLTLVRRIVELHGGSVEARSEGPGRGSEFVLRLPVVAPPSLEAKSPRGAAAQSVKRRILVADDNPDSATSLAMMLRIMGNEVRSVTDGENALREAATFRPDIVLLDIGIPRVDGYATARRVRESPWGRDVTLIAVTGWGQDDYKRRSQEAGFDHHLVKPVDIPTLVGIVGQSSPVSRTA